MTDTKDISMHFWVSQEEYDLILKNMALSGSTNLSAFLRKMAIDGMQVLRLSLMQKPLQQLEAVPSGILLTIIFIAAASRKGSLS